RVGVSDGDFLPHPGAPIKKGSVGVEREEECPYLGQPMKPTVLIAEKTSSLARFTQRWLHRRADSGARERLPGRTMFTGVSMEHVLVSGYDLDTTLHCALASEVVLSLLDGFRNNGFEVPFWF